MTDRPFMDVPRPQPEKRIFANDAALVLQKYVARPDFSVHPSNTQRAAEIITSSRANARDALGTCIDLSGDKNLVTNSADILAKMFHDGDKSLPENWRSNPEIMRTVLSMAANVDIGYLNAMEIHQRRQGISIAATENLKRKQDFLSDLQKTQS